jgi:hypothetical protein
MGVEGKICLNVILNSGIGMGIRSRVSSGVSSEMEAVLLKLRSWVLNFVGLVGSWYPDIRNRATALLPTHQSVARWSGDSPHELLIKEATKATTQWTRFC